LNGRSESPATESAAAQNQKQSEPAKVYARLRKGSIVLPKVSHGSLSFIRFSARVKRRFSQSAGRRRLSSKVGRDKAHPCKIGSSLSYDYEVAFFKREASEPVSMRFDNSTTKMSITKRDQILGRIFEYAQKIHAQWLKDDIERLSEITGQSVQQIEAARRQLASVK